MNFANKLMASAEQAALVAKNFKGFDEMADEDEYIHSEGLNVKTSSQQQQQQQQQEEMEPPREENFSVAESNASAEPTWSLLDRPAVTNTANAPANARGRPMSRNTSTISSASPASSMSPPPRQKPPRAPKPKPATNYFSQAPQSQRSGMGYLSVVADALETGSMSGSARQQQQQQSSFSGYDSDNEESSVHNDSSSSSSSDDSDDEDDAILSQIRQNKSASSRDKKHPIRPKKSKKKKKKNPNRFMEELDRRAPVPVPGSASAAEFAQQHQALEIEPAAINDNAGGGRLNNLKNWINPFQRNINSPDSVVAKATSFLKLGPLSRRDISASPTEPKESEEFQVLAGTSVLSDDELAALAQMNSQQSVFSPGALVQKIRKNPRESFIVFTMLLAIFIYFYNRRTSNEDDVQ